ncbi:S10 family serine carboxypeptidase-like protein [Luteimonas huabeiensis]|uniref:S10 family serine carboxypeptidase-like protein n=1 Tax=Luteimonas huabeiensis TaxID=1244513 RepID=UPI000467BC38|nr:hypothetical protein [Luteimonas huabeiensis]
MSGVAANGHGGRAASGLLAAGALLAGLLACAAVARAGDALPEPARARWTWPGHANAPARTVEVVAEELPMAAADGGIEATMFSTAYLAAPDDAGAGDAGRARPVAFFWNGGPGSAAVGLHATFAPRTPGAAPERAEARGSIDNPDSPIDIADLVFVDPVGTGYSRVLREGAGAGYWGVAQDAEAAARFVAAWLRRHGRERDPVLLVGQSYAGIRVPLAAQRLLEAMPDLDLRGLLLVSPSIGGPRADAADAAAQARRDHARCRARLAVYAQTAAFHGIGAQAGRAPAEIAADVEAFLAARERFDADDHARIAADIGLPREQVAEAGGCVAPLAFQTGLLAARGERIGTADTRLHAPLALTRTRQPPYDDPATSPYTLGYDLDAAWRHYLRHEIGYRPAGEGDYVRLSLAAHGAWDWTWPAWAGASTATVLDGLLARAPGLRVRVAVGYYDLSVPYLEPVRAFEAAGLPGPRFAIVRYPAGHAVHADREARPRSFADLRALIGGAP